MVFLWIRIITIAGVNIVVDYTPRESGIKFSTRSINKKIKANDLARYAEGFFPMNNLVSNKSLYVFVTLSVIKCIKGV